MESEWRARSRGPSLTIIADPPRSIFLSGERATVLCSSQREQISTYNVTRRLLVARYPSATLRSTSASEHSAHASYDNALALQFTMPVCNCGEAESLCGCVTEHCRRRRLDRRLLTGAGSLCVRGTRDVCTWLLECARRPYEVDAAMARALRRRCGLALICAAGWIVPAVQTFDA